MANVSGQTATHLVLVVDDDDALRDILVEVLRREGYLALGAANGAQALAIVNAFVADVVLLDIRMPEVNGEEFVRRARQRGYRTKVIVMTGAAEAKAWAARLRADGCLPKPLHINALLAEVERLCQAA